MIELVVVAFDSASEFTRERDQMHFQIGGQILPMNAINRECPVGIEHLCPWHRLASEHPNPRRKGGHVVTCLHINNHHGGIKNGDQDDCNAFEVSERTTGLRDGLKVKSSLDQGLHDPIEGIASSKFGFSAFSRDAAKCMAH